MKTEHRQLLKDMIDIITFVSDNAVVKAYDVLNEIQIKTIDKSHISYLKIILTSDFFKHFSKTGDIKCSINFTKIKKVFGSSKKKGVVTLSFKDNKFILEYDNKIFKVKIDNPEDSYYFRNEPDVEYNSDSQEIKCNDLYEDLKTLYKVDNIVHVKSQDNELVFQTKNMEMTSFVKCKKPFVEEYESCYNLDFLLPVLKILKKYDIYLTFKTNYPLMIKLDKLGCEMTYIVAPRISGD